MFFCFGSFSSYGVGRFGVRNVVICWVMSVEFLGSRRSSFFGEGKVKKVETFAGGGEDSTGVGF